VPITISMINVKGGVGKTTIAFNLAHALKILNRRVLLLDLDLQENLTDKAIANPKEIKTTVYDLILKDDVMALDCLYDTVVKDVSIIPSDIEVVRIKKEMDPASNPDILFRLKDKLDSLKHMFDYILIDLHPDVDILTTMALMASNYYIIPVKPDTDSIKGLKITDEYAGKLVRANKQLKELGIVITDFDKRTSIANSFHDSVVKMFGARIMNSVIGRNAAITTAASGRQTIFQFDLRQSGCAAFRSLAKEIILKCEGTEVDINGEEEAI
jgi:chromosome partitioning protein